MVSKAPPSRHPAGVPPGGGTKYAVAAALLVGLIVAVVVWKVVGQKPPPPAVVIADAAPPTTFNARNPDDEVPPPPPVEDAGPKNERKVTAHAENQCGVPRCTGSNSNELESALSFRVKQAHRCYDNALAQDPTLRGKVTVAVRIGATGTVCSAGIASNEMSSAQVANCVSGYFRGNTFPAPRGGCVDVNIPINFVPRQ
jgi:hypothetical protein